MTTAPNAPASDPSGRFTTARPLRVLHVHSGNLFGGIEVFLRTLVRARAHCPWAVHEFALSFQARLADELRAAGATVHVLGEVRLRAPWRTLLARRALAKLIARGRYDVAVVHSAWAQTLFGPTLRARGLPIAFVQHAGGIARASWLERVARRVRPDVAIANSAFSAASLPVVLPGVPARVVTLPAELPAAPADASTERARVRAENGANEGTAVVLMVSRLDRGKGVHLALDALAGMQTARPWVGWIAGGAQNTDAGRAYERALREAAQGAGLAGRVRFLGERRDVPALMRAADVFCQANVEPESFGMTFVEALTAGLPVVTTAMGGALEVVDASCGLLVAPRVDAVRVALAGLIDDEARRVKLGAAGPARARALCDPATQVPRFAEALAEAAHRG